MGKINSIDLLKNDIKKGLSPNFDYHNERFVDNE